MEQPEDSPRDLAALVVSRVGRRDGSGAGCDPYRLVDGDGAVIEAVAEYFRDLQAAGRSASTLRSYGLDLLRWFRVLVGDRCPVEPGVADRGAGLLSVDADRGQAEPPALAPSRRAGGAILRGEGLRAVGAGA